MTPMRANIDGPPRRDQDQGLHRRLPLRGLMLGGRQPGDVIASILESEMLRRGMFFDVIDWSEDQGALPF
jgi:hypothetical protein